MVKIFNVALICLLCVCLAGCMYAVPKDRIAAMERVGVVSFLGDVIDLREERLLPPGIVSAPFRVNSWRIDRYTRALITDEISRHGTKMVIPFEYDHELLWSKNYDGPEIRTEKLRDTLRNALSEIARHNNLDALIIVYSPPQQFVAAPYQTLPFCLYRYYGLTGKSVNFYIKAGIRVLDGKSMETLGSAGFFYKESLDGSFWPHFADTDQLVSLENRTKDTLRQKVSLKLKELGFGETDK